jgi:outer membrane protein, heavy metal efflux system
LPNPSLAVGQSLVPYPGGSKADGPMQLDVEVSYSLDTLLFGKRSAAMEAARAGVDVALAEYSDVARQRILAAITAYYDVLQARELLDIAREEVAQLERLETLTERRVALASVGPIELDRIRIAVIGGKRRLVQAEAELDNARSRLRTHLGQARGAKRADAAGTLDLSSPPPLPELPAALALAEANRPDFLAVRRQASRARADLTRERRAAWPTLGVAAGYSRQFYEAEGRLGNDFWGVGLELSPPLFDRNQGNIARGESSVRQADLMITATRIDLEAEVEQALRSYRAARQSVTTLDQQALDAASRARQRIEEAYGLGGRTLLEVLDAQAAYREVFREHISARADLFRSLHKLNAVVGTEMIR